MRRKAALLLTLILTLAALTAAPAFLYSAEKDWRQRASSEAVEVSGSDVSEEVRFGREVAARILGRMGLYDKPAITKYVSLVGKSIAMNTARPEIEFRFAVLDTSEINAYAAPGGYVFITKGALSLLEDESELAGVLAHEIAHVTERHIVKELDIKGTEESPVAGLARLIGGGSESARVAFHQAAEKAMDILFKDGYKREDEIQADGRAVLFTALSDYDPSGLPNYLERIGKAKGKETEVLDKTHPPYDARVGWLKDTMSKEGIDPSGFKSNKDRFKQVMSALK